VLEESEAKLEDERETDIGIIVLRAMKTRRKNAAAEAEATRLS
jgi:hypothetical protein